MDYTKKLNHCFIWLNLFDKIVFMWKHKIIVCSSIMTGVCITSECRSVTEHDAHFDKIINIVYMH